MESKKLLLVSFKSTIYHRDSYKLKASLPFVPFPVSVSFPFL